MFLAPPGWWPRSSTGGFDRVPEFESLGRAIRAAPTSRSAPSIANQRWPSKGTTDAHVKKCRFTLRGATEETVTRRKLRRVHPQYLPTIVAKDSSREQHCAHYNAIKNVLKPMVVQRSDRLPPLLGDGGLSPSSRSTNQPIGRPPVTFVRRLPNSNRTSVHS
jgi:hypothetical protein